MPRGDEGASLLELIGRGRELTVLLEVLERSRTGAGAVVLEGGAGVGKTALWRSGIDAAREQGYRILETAPTRSEARLAFTALGDLLDREVDEVIAGLPEPQRRTIEIALLRRDGSPGEVTVDTRLVGVATLSALRALSGRAPLVVAIDDLQWVDPASAAALRFALRRLRDEPVAILATRRTERPTGALSEFDRLLEDERVHRLPLEPLSVGALHELLLSRLGLDAPRPTLIRLYELTGGNPFFALEMGRELIARNTEPTPHDPLPVPGSVRELVQSRFARLSEHTRGVLLAAAALARPTTALLARLDPHAAEAAVGEGVAAGLIELGAAGRVRFTHPLFGSIHYEQAPLGERRRLHSRLSQVVEDAEERGRHLALATEGVDDDVAAQLDAAARSASLRGAPNAAAELCDLAARLTSTPGERAARVLASAEHHRHAGHLGVATDRAREVLATSGAQPEVRARALAVLGTVTTDSEGIEAGAALYQRALRESGASRSLRSDVHHKLAWLCLVAGDAGRAERHARAMTRLTDEAEPAAAAAAAVTLSHAIVARGAPVPRELLARALELDATVAESRPWVWSETGPRVLEGVVLLWGGEIEEARAPLERVHRAATESGHLWLEMQTLAYLSSIETALGRPQSGWELAHRYLELAAMVGQAAHRAGALWPVAVSAGWLGRPEEARDAAIEGLRLAERMGNGLYVIGHLGALGATELAEGEPATAAAPLLRAWELARRGGIGSPARFPIHPDAVEALTDIGEDRRAAELAGELGRIAQAIGRPWIRALAQRCEGLVAEAQGHDELAIRAFEGAMTAHGLQDRPLDRARTLLAFGRLHRRRRRKGAARERLQEALAIFMAAGASGWAQRAHSELGRIGGRQAAAAGELSATESAIARLVASGRTNREVAGTLHLSARTVEWNLSRVYRKLGVRSRTELAGALARARRQNAGHPPGAAPG